MADQDATWPDDWPVQKELPDITDKHCLVPGESLRKLAGCDIHIPKSTRRTAQHLFVLPGILSLPKKVTKSIGKVNELGVASGLGRMEDVSLQLGESLTMQGRRIPTKTRFLALSVKQNKITVKAVLSSVHVFGETQRLTEDAHEAVGIFHHTGLSSRAEYKGNSSAATKSPGRKPPPMDESDDDSCSDEASADSFPKAGLQLGIPSPRRSSRRSRTSISFIEDNEEGDSNLDSSPEDHEEGEDFLPATRGQRSPVKARATIGDDEATIKTPSKRRHPPPKAKTSDSDDEVSIGVSSAIKINIQSSQRRPQHPMESFLAQESPPVSEACSSTRSNDGEEDEAERTSSETSKLHAKDATSSAPLEKKLSPLKSQRNRRSMKTPSKRSTDIKHDSIGSDVSASLATCQRETLSENTSRDAGGSSMKDAQQPSPNQNFVSERNLGSKKKRARSVLEMATSSSPQAHDTPQSFESTSETSKRRRRSKGKKRSKSIWDAVEKGERLFSAKFDD